MHRLAHVERRVSILLKLRSRRQGRRLARRARRTDGVSILLESRSVCQVATSRSRKLSRWTSFNPLQVEESSSSCKLCLRSEAPHSACFNPLRVEESLSICRFSPLEFITVTVSSFPHRGLRAIQQALSCTCYRAAEFEVCGTPTTDTCGSPLAHACSLGTR